MLAVRAIAVLATLVLALAPAAAQDALGLRVQVGHADPVEQVVWSPDGGLAVSVSQGGRPLPARLRGRPGLPDRGAVMGR